ncbi:hypothetical protein [Jiulongibacter sediminis]|uniref:hypothetical protein n=1 Tax=Jiulongibacter sediminis TaxID=1605367 RepID=UPI0026EA1D6A|nr:hypothetical protein [Jiulongibacter sediminis]
MNKSAVFLLLLLFSVLLACSDARLRPADRLYDPELGVTFTRNISELFDDWASKSTIKTINSYADMPLVGPYGSRLYVSPRDLISERGGSVSYPFEIEFREVLTPREMILHRAPTMAGDRLLFSGGEFFLNISKNGEELKLAEVSNLRLEAVSLVSGDQFNYFQGQRGLDGMIDWQEGPEMRRIGFPCEGQIQSSQDCWETDAATLQQMKERQDSLENFRNEYLILPTELGWINIDHYGSFEGDKVQISVQVKSGIPEAFFVFLYIPSTNSLMDVPFGKKFPLPVGLEVEIVAFGLTVEDRLFTGHQNMLIETEGKIEIQVSGTSKNDWLNYLDTLRPH